MDATQELDAGMKREAPANEVRVQGNAYLLELSHDWIVLRTSENIHRLLGESHVTLIDEPFGKFVHAQALHDLRNTFSRLSGTTGIGRAYAVRLTDDQDRVDMAFQLADGRALLEAVPAARSFGECYGSVGGLIAGLANSHGQALLDGGARRMRALTGYDRVTLSCGARSSESSRSAFDGAANPEGLPMIIADTMGADVGIFPRASEDTSVASALLRAPEDAQRRKLGASGIRAILRLPFEAGGLDCEFCCESHSARPPSFELHAAAELFAQMFAMRLELDDIVNG